MVSEPPAPARLEVVLGDRRLSIPQFNATLSVGEAEVEFVVPKVVHADLATYVLTHAGALILSVNGGEPIHARKVGGYRRVAHEMYFEKPVRFAFAWGAPVSPRARTPRSREESELSSRSPARAGFGRQRIHS